MIRNKLFTINKRNIIFRLFIISIIFLISYWLSYYLSLNPYFSRSSSELFNLNQAFEMFILMLISFYIPIELAILLIRLFLFWEFKSKNFLAVFYLLFFIGLNLVWGFGNGKFDRYFIVGGYFFAILLIGVLISFFKKK